MNTPVLVPTGLTRQDSNTSQHWPYGVFLPPQYSPPLTSIPGRYTRRPSLPPSHHGKPLKEFKGPPDGRHVRRPNSRRAGLAALAEGGDKLELGEGRQVVVVGNHRRAPLAGARDRDRLGRGGGG